MDNFVSEMLKGISKSIGVSVEDMMADFANFSKAIDEKIAEGYSEEEATNIVASSWNYDWIDTPVEE